LKSSIAAILILTYLLTYLLTLQRGLSATAELLVYTIALCICMWHCPCTIL